MDREEAKAFVNSQEPTFLPKAKVGYVCPHCGNGSGDTGTGITKDPDSGRWHCFVCNLHEDIPGLWKEQNGIADMGRAFEEVYSYYGVTIEEAPAGSRKDTHTHNSMNTYTYTQTEEKGKEEASKADYTELYQRASKDLNKTSYHRGISTETLSRYGVGYIEQWTHPKDGKHFSPRLIIPTSRGSYIARDTRETVPDREKEYTKSKVGKVHLFNSQALYEAQKPIFIVEGELDALSIIDVGGEAVALGSTSNKRMFIDQIKKEKPAQPLILALDNDPEGIKCGNELEEELRQLCIPFQRLNPYDNAKDANEALQKDSEALRRAVGEAEATARENAQREAEEAQEAAREEYMQTSVAAHIQEFIDGVADSVNTPYIPTGFQKLDNALDGGLYEGLYILGAVSSLGKTSFVLQCCDQIAEGGNDVIIFSLEMARAELMAKSISRLTLLDVLQNNGNTMDAKTTRGITTGKRYANYSQTEKDLIQRATLAYSEYAGNIYIHEGIGDIGVNQIRETVERHIGLMGKRPVIIIDYIQILSPFDVRATDKQNTDKAVMELKRISRDYKIPVIGISSFNRDNYSAPVNMASFKESGSIEYSSDVLLGMQYKGAGGNDFKVDEAMKKNPRDVELVVLKNRNGATGARLDYEYYKIFNYFKEA